MKKALLYSLLFLIFFSCVESEEVIIPKELAGKWVTELNLEEDTWETFLEFKTNGSYEGFTVRNIQNDSLQPGILTFSKGKFSKREGNLILSSIRTFYAEDKSNPPSEIGLLKEQVEWLIPDEVAEFSLHENDQILILTFLGCKDVQIPRNSANCAPPTPVTYTRVVE